MVWCRQATSHYLSQWWPRSMSPYGVTRPQWVHAITKTATYTQTTHVLVLTSFCDQFHLWKRYICAYSFAWCLRGQHINTLNFISFHIWGPSWLVPTDPRRHGGCRYVEHLVPYRDQAISKHHDNSTVKPVFHESFPTAQLWYSHWPRLFGSGGRLPVLVALLLAGKYFHRDKIHGTNSCSVRCSENA